MTIRGRTAHLASLLALIVGMPFAVAGPVAAGPAVTDDGFVLVGSDRAWAAIQGQAWQPNQYVPECIWDLRVSVVAADRFVPIGTGAPHPHGDVEVWVSNDANDDCPESIAGWYGVGGVTDDVSMTSLVSASLENNYHVRVNDQFEVCLTLEWNATSDPRPVTGPRDRLSEVSRQTPADVSGAVTLYCGTNDPLALETVHDEVEIADAHLARSTDVHLDLP